MQITLISKAGQFNTFVDITIKQIPLGDLTTGQTVAEKKCNLV